MRVVIDYEVADGNQQRSIELLQDVYAELERTRPAGLRYETFRLDDSGRFLAVIEADGGPGEAPHHLLPSFQRYRAALDELCSRPPRVTPVETIGAYRSA